MECLEDCPNLSSHLYKSCPLCTAYPAMSVSEARTTHILHEDYFYLFYSQKVVPDVTASIDQSTTTVEANEEEIFLLINNIKLCSNTTSDIHTHISFEYDINSRKSLTNNLIVRNGTPYALRYYFTRRKGFSLFRNIAPENKDQVFFYNKGEEVMLPFEELKIPITFKTDFASTYKLQLEFHTRPQLWNQSTVVNLLGVATYGDIADKCEKIKARIESKIYHSIAKDTINDILNDIPHSDDEPETFYIYDKAAIFEATNQDFNPITRRPKYVYDKEVVDELEEFYASVRVPTSPITWNLNIEELREITRQRQKINYQNKFLVELVNVKTVDEEKKALADSSDKISERSSKIKRVRTITKEITSKTDKIKSMKSLKSLKSILMNEGDSKKIGENLTESLENILLKLDVASTWVNESKDVYESCYTVICTAIDIILKEVRKLERDLDICKRDKYPMQYSYDLHSFSDRIIEVHEDLPGQPPRIFDDFLKEAKETPEFMRRIPIEESEKRYKTYYNIPDEPTPNDGRTKEKKGKSEKSKGTKSNDKKTKKEKSTPTVKSKPKSASMIFTDINLKENPYFNPSEEMVPKAKETNSMYVSTISDESTSSDLLSGLLMKEHKRMLYDIFYKNLVEAALNLVDVIEVHNTKRFKLENMKRILDETSSQIRPVNVKVIDLKLAIRLALDLPTKHHPLHTDVQSKPKEMPLKYEDPVQLKEDGSEWSILRPLKVDTHTPKPISYPEVNIYLRKKMAKRHVRDVGTIMSNAGIHPGWTDFKNVGVQMTCKRETRAQKEVFALSMLSHIVDDICLEETAASGIEGEGVENDSKEVLYEEPSLNLNK